MPTDPNSSEGPGRVNVPLVLGAAVGGAAIPVVATHPEWLGGIGGALPDAATVMMLVFFVAVLGLVALGAARAFKHWRQRKGLRSAPSVDDTNPGRVAAFQKRWSETFSKGADDRVQPLFLLMGESASGKSYLLHKSEIQLVGGEPDGWRGGTIETSWWVFKDGNREPVVFDTAGESLIRIPTGPVASGPNDSIPREKLEAKWDWPETLKRLKKYRRRCPLNGVMVAVPATSLLGDSPETQRAKAEQIRHRLNEIHKYLKVRVPVTLVLTKMDKVIGFVSFIDGLGENARYAMCGWSPGPIEKNDRFSAETMVDAWITRLRAAMAMRVRRDLLDPHRADKSPLDRVVFPSQLNRLAEGLRTYLSTIFAVPISAQLAAPFFRGVLLTSAMQQKNRAAVERNTEEEENTFPYGAKDLLQRKLFEEVRLVTPVGSASSALLRNQLRLAAALGIAAGVLFWAVWIVMKSIDEDIGKYDRIFGKLATHNDPWIKQQDDGWVLNTATVDLFAKSGEDLSNAWTLGHTAADNFKVSTLLRLLGVGQDEQEAIRKGMRKRLDEFVVDRVVKPLCGIGQDGKIVDKPWPKLIPPSVWDQRQTDAAANKPPDEPKYEYVEPGSLLARANAIHSLADPMRNDSPSDKTLQKIKITETININDCTEAWVKLTADEMTRVENAKNCMAIAMAQASLGRADAVKVTSKFTTTLQEKCLTLLTLGLDTAVQEAEDWRKTEIQRQEDQKLEAKPVGSARDPRWPWERPELDEKCWPLVKGWAGWQPRKPPAIDSAIRIATDLKNGRESRAEDKNVPGRQAPTPTPTPAVTTEENHSRAYRLEADLLLGAIQAKNLAYEEAPGDALKGASPDALLPNLRQRVELVAGLLDYLGDDKLRGKAEKVLQSTDSAIELNKLEGVKADELELPTPDKPPFTLLNHASVKWRNAVVKEIQDTKKYTEQPGLAANVSVPASFPTYTGKLLCGSYPDRAKICELGTRWNALLKLSADAQERDPRFTAMKELADQLKTAVQGLKPVELPQPNLPTQGADPPDEAAIKDIDWIQKNLTEQDPSKLIEAIWEIGQNSQSGVNARDALLKALTPTPVPPQPSAVSGTKSQAPPQAVESPYPAFRSDVCPSEDTKGAMSQDGTTATREDPSREWAKKVVEEIWKVGPSGANDWVVYATPVGSPKSPDSYVVAYAKRLVSAAQRKHREAVRTLVDAGKKELDSLAREFPFADSETRASCEDVKNFFKKYAGVLKDLPKDSNDNLERLETVNKLLRLDKCDFQGVTYRKTVGQEWNDLRMKNGTLRQTLGDSDRDKLPTTKDKIEVLGSVGLAQLREPAQFRALAEPKKVRLGGTTQNGYFYGIEIDLEGENLSEWVRLLKAPEGGPASATPAATASGSGQ
ncbi:MAG: type VI secretion protein IcmF/TssM N-terminal domain-containing protein [Phycisphaerales bacterium]